MGGYIFAPSVLPIFPFWSVLNSAAGIFRQTCHTSSHQNFATPLPTPESQSQHSQLAMSEAGLFLGRYRYPQSQSQARAQQQLQKNFDALFFPFLPARPCRLRMSRHGRGRTLLSRTRSLFVLGRKTAEQTSNTTSICLPQTREIIRPLFLIYHEVARSWSPVTLTVGLWGLIPPARQRPSRRDLISPRRFFFPAHKSSRAQNLRSGEGEGREYYAR